MSYFYLIFAFLLTIIIRSFQHSSKLLSNDGKQGGILDRVFGTKVEKATQAHSVLLADQQILFELQSNVSSLVRLLN
jgi:hypothetical protein